MNEITCPQLTLVEAFYDSRLGTHEHASLSRHIAACAECSALARDLERIDVALRAPVEPATPLEHQRARAGLQRTAAHVPARPPRAVLVFAATALMFATVAGLAAGRLTAPSRNHERVPLVTTVEPSGGARFQRANAAGIDEVTLDDGALDVTVRALPPGERFVLHTKDAELGANDATFHVEAEGGRIRGFDVVSGSVEVRYSGFTAVIPSGGSWKRAAQEPPLADRSGAVDVSTAGPAASTPPPRVVEEPPATGATASSVSAQRMIKQGTVRPSSSTPARPAVESRPPTPQLAVTADTSSTASLEFAEAIRILEGGDYDGGAAKLQAFATAHPSDPRSDEAEYVRVVAVRRAGRASEAAAAARRYLATRPNGAHRAEVKRIAGE